MNHSDMFHEPEYQQQYTSFEKEPIGVYAAKTFAWMGLGLLITFAVAWIVSRYTPLGVFVYQMPMMPFILLIVEVLLVMQLHRKVYELGVEQARALFLMYAVVNGITFSGILLFFDLNSVISIFALTSLYFFAMAAYGCFTKRDLTKIIPILTFGAFFLLIFWVLSSFLPFSDFERMMSIVGLAIFMGFTAYDTQKIRHFYQMYDAQSAMGKKLSIIGALALYLDFINLFVYLLRLVGRGSRD